MEALESNYKDPFKDLVKQLHKKSLEADEKANSGDNNIYTAPVSAIAIAGSTTSSGPTEFKDFLKTPMESIPERPSYVPSDPSIENP